MAPPELRGDKVLLRAVRPGDAADRRRHGWSAEIERCYGHETDDGPMSQAQARTWLDACEAAQVDGHHWIVDVGGRAMGEAFLQRVDQTRDLRGSYAVGLFDPGMLGRGIGRDVTRTVLTHAFDTLGLHRVDLRVLEFNTRAIASYRSCGFVEEGRERESCRLDGRWYDDVMMSVLDREFRTVRGRVGT